MEEKRDTLLKKVLSGKMIEKQEAMELWDCGVEELADAADEIRKRFCGNHFDFCTIINGKSGKCSENCKFCAQSIFQGTGCETYPLLEKEELLKLGKYNEERGILRYSVVTSGKRLSKKEVEMVCEGYKYLRKNTELSLCGSHGLLDLEDFTKLKEAGVTRYHNNLETSRRYFLEICTTHSYEEKIQAIQNAKKAGLEVCSGGIIGMGETREDRVDLAIELRKLEVCSVPLNILNPIPGTPLEKLEPISEEEIRKTAAIFRFLLPNVWIRTAGGRIQLQDGGANLFAGGINGAITGDMLTTSGSMIEQDKQRIQELGYEE